MGIKYEAMKQRRADVSRDQVDAEIARLKNKKAGMCEDDAAGGGMEGERPRGFYSVDHISSFDRSLDGLLGVGAERYPVSAERRLNAHLLDYAATIDFRKQPVPEQEPMYDDFSGDDICASAESGYWNAS